MMGARRSDGAMFSMLPEEVVEKILRRLDDVGDVARFSLVSKHWYNFVHSKKLWRRRATIGCMIVYNERDCSSYSIFDDSPTVLSCLSSKHKMRSTCGYLNSGFLPGQDCEPCICPEQSWKEQPWPHEHLIRYLDSSHGLLCAYDIMSDTLYLFDPCRSPSLRSLGGPPLYDTDQNVRNLSFRVDLLDDSYVVVLVTTTLHLLVYQSRTANWSRSSHKYPGSSYDLREPTQPHPIVGNLIYFLGKDGKIWSYSIDGDSWSYKRFLLPEDHFEELRLEVLIQMRGKLMLVGINEKQQLLSTWLCNEEEESFFFTPLSSLQIYDDLTLSKVTAGDDLVCVQSYFVDGNGTTQTLVFVYCPSMDTWRYLDTKPCGHEVYSVDYFVAEAKIMSSGAMRDHFQIIGKKDGRRSCGN